jgi:hypothetical protein
VGINLLLYYRIVGGYEVRLGPLNDSTGRDEPRLFFSGRHKREAVLQISTLGVDEGKFQELKTTSFYMVEMSVIDRLGFKGIT